ncbi:MAG: hypothetical protein IJD23_02485 [Spirochaetaceae bacterium]|nr:hypothetical protein [Spirochaetaceae bacterium]
MAASLKQLSELKQICTEQKKKAQSIQTEIGFSLLSQGDCGISENDLNKYNESLEKSKQNDLLAEEVKSKSLEIENIQEELLAIKKQLEESQAKQNQEFIELAEVLYANYRDSYAEFFKTFHDEISELNNKLQGLESQSEVLKSQIETQGFFGKLVNQVKLTSSASSVNSAKKKKESVLQKAGSFVVSQGKIDFIRSQENLEYSILTILDKVQNSQFVVDEILQKQKNLISTEKSLKDEFAKIAEGANLKAKLSNLEKNNEIQQQTRSKIALSVGEEFSKKYISDKGEKFDGYDSVVQNFPAFVDLAESFDAISKAEIQLEIYQTESDIESCVSRIYNMQQTIISNEKKIETLKSNNTQLAEKITSEGDLKDSLLRKKSELEQKLQ